MQLCDKTVSLFNRRIDSATRCAVWEKTLLTGVSWYCRDVSAVTNEGLKSVAQYIVRIPFDDDYVSPAAYTGTGWTLQTGDYMVLGDVDYNAAMTETYGSACMTITAATDNRRATCGKHFKVVGA